MTAILIPGTDQILVSFADITEIKRLIWEKEQAQLEALRVHKLAFLGVLQHLFSEYHSQEKGD